MSIDSGSMSCCSVPTFTVFGLGRRIGYAKTDLNDSDISPVQMLGTVYYDTDQLLKNAEQAGKYTIVDDLVESADAGDFRGWYFRFSDSGASAFRKLSRTMTTWDGRTLYAILDKSDKDWDEVGGRVQKINLVDAKAVWWSEGLDMEYPWTYIAGPFRGSITGGGVPGGAPVDFWGGFVPQYPENVNAIVSESCWGLEDFKDAAYYGFGDLGFGKLGISENENKGEIGSCGSIRWTKTGLEQQPPLTTKSKGTGIQTSVFISRVLRAIPTALVSQNESSPSVSRRMTGRMVSAFMSRPWRLKREDGRRMDY